MTRTLLIANRGEIAVRIARTARELGLRTIAVYSDADATALHVATCDDAVRIGPPSPSASYLNVPALLAAAKATGAHLIHPGYGFLSENADFADAVEAAGIEWVGPTGASMRALGSKLGARAVATSLGIPVLPSARPGESFANVGFPLLIKASGGGGGRGMRRVDDASGVDEAVEAARAEALAAFGDDTVYAERLLLSPRHIEVQVFGDGEGGVSVLSERDCSIQRRHQKLIEEAPCAFLGDLRGVLHERARALAASVRYRSAGTVEFLWDGQEAWFLEMNTRLQVEHPVTEMVLGLDLVAAQLQRRLPAESEPQGHAIECRVVAEDPAAGFLPAPGRLGVVRWPRGPGVRVDEGVRESGGPGASAGDVVPPDYDALIAKIIVHAPTREAARQRMLRALEDTVVTGVPTTIERLIDTLRDGAFIAQNHSTGTLADVVAGDVDPALVLAAAALATASPRAEVGGGGPAAGPWQTVGRWA